MNNTTAGITTSTAYPQTRRGRMQARRARHMADITAYPATRSAAMVVLPMSAGQEIRHSQASVTPVDDRQLQPTG